MFVTEVQALRPDFLLSFQAAQLLRPPLIATAALAALNLHYGPLPRYRGVAPIAWAIINGEIETGVSLHYIEPGIDSGAVVAAAKVPIDPDDSGRTLYDKCTAAAIELFRQSWPTVRLGAIQSRLQPPDEALYYNRYAIDFTRRTIRWGADARTMANWIRAFIFPPFQFPIAKLGGTELEVGSVSWDRLAHAARPATILAIESDEIVVAAPGGRLRLGKLRHGSTVVAAPRFSGLGLVVGAVFD